MTAVLDRPLTPCSTVLDGPVCARLTLATPTTTTTTTAPVASDDVCPLTNRDSCPSSQAEINTCGAC